MFTNIYIKNVASLNNLLWKFKKCDIKAKNNNTI